MTWPARCSRSKSKFDPANRSPQHIAQTTGMGSLNAMRHLEVLHASPSPCKDVNRSSERHKSGSRHSKPLACGAFQTNIQREPFIVSQQGCVSAGLNVIKVQIDALEVLTGGGLNRNLGRNNRPFWRWLIGFNTAHHLRCVGRFSMQFSGDFNTVMNRKSGAFAALTSHQRVGFVNGEEQRDVATASLDGGGLHGLMPRGVG